VEEAERKLGACAQYVFGEERGEQGTPHLQGAVRFGKKQRFTAVKKLFGDQLHWSKMRDNWAINVAYCTKEWGGDWSKIHGNIPEASRWKPWEQAVMDTVYKNVVWYDWQQDVIDIVAGKPDPRAIWWFHEPDGATGKSFLMKWLWLNHRCIVGGGKNTDVFHQVAKFFEANPKTWPKLILLDIPRSSQQWCNYGAIEHLKNGFVNSGKYEGGVFAWPWPHVVVFSNELPNEGAMSSDRWKVVRVWPQEKRTVVDALMGVANSKYLIV